MKRVNKILKLSIFLALFAGLISCGKDDAAGPVGPEGPVDQRGDKGDQGAKGADGTPLRYGNGAPASSLGNEQDFYIDIKNSNLYGPKTDNGWGAAVNLKGSTGEKRVVLIPELIAKAHAAALSKLNLNNYNAISAYFNLKD